MNKMHILIIPSEEFIPEYNKLDGIFQYHQAVILKEAGHKVGVLSVKLSFSIPMIIKGTFFKLIGKKAANATDDYKASYLLKLGAKKIFQPQLYVTKEETDGLSVYRVDGLFFRPPVNNKNHISWVKAGMVCFKEYIRANGKPDVIHAHNGIYAGMLAQKIYEKFALRYIITEHSSTYALKMADEPTLHRVKKAYDKASGLFAVSEAFAQLLNNLFSFGRFHYLPNVLDQHLEKKKFQPLENKKDKFIFLHIAGLLPVKDQPTLLKAFKKVADENNHVELWIGGGGELLDELKQQTENLHISNSVKFLGVLNRDEVISRIQACDCFVLSSRYETFGVVVIEAMLFGKPVIVTRCGVGQNIVDDKIGYVVDVGNEGQLADAMLKMISTHSNYNPDYIRDYTIKNFGKERFLQNINKIYKAVV